MGEGASGGFSELFSMPGETFILIPVLSAFNMFSKLVFVCGSDIFWRNVAKEDFSFKNWYLKLCLTLLLSLVNVMFLKWMDLSGKKRYDLRLNIKFDQPTGKHNIKIRQHNKRLLECIVGNHR